MLCPFSVLDMETGFMVHLILLLVCSTPFYQNVVDQPAKKLMDKVARHYKELKGFEIKFQYEIKIDQNLEGPYSGQLISNGEKYKLVIPDLDLYCDGTAQYAHLKKNNEIQISKPQTTDTRYHPSELARIHQSGQYEYRILEKIRENEKNLSVVEFKPSKREDNVFKIKLFILEPANSIEKVQWFEKSGKSTTVRFLKTTKSTKLSDQLFKPDFEKLKGVHVEDLRDE